MKDRPYMLLITFRSGVDLGGGCGGFAPPLPQDDLLFSNTTGIPPKKKTMWFIGVEEKQEMSAPPPKKNPGSAPAGGQSSTISMSFSITPNMQFKNSLDFVVTFLIDIPLNLLSCKLFIRELLVFENLTIN